MLQPIPGSIDLLTALERKLGRGRRPLIIGIDGRSGAGKSTLASWLAWQIGMPAVHLDLYIERESDALGWRYDDLARVIDARLTLRRPLIVEGVCLCEPLAALGRNLDYWVWMENLGGREHGPEERTGDYDYITELYPEANADFTLTWQEKEPTVGFV